MHSWHLLQTKRCKRSKGLGYPFHIRVRKTGRDLVEDARTRVSKHVLVEKGIETGCKSCSKSSTCVNVGGHVWGIRTGQLCQWINIQTRSGYFSPKWLVAEDSSITLMLEACLDEQWFVILDLACVSISTLLISLLIRQAHQSLFWLFYFVKHFCFLLMSAKNIWSLVDPPDFTTLCVMILS